MTNTGEEPILLENVTIRYYFTKDGNQAQNFFCDWSHAGSEYVKGSFHDISPAVAGADCYLEIGFDSGAGSLSPGQSIEVHTRVSKVDWSNYDLTDDYSYKPTGDSYEIWDRVTAYISGVLVFGNEPQ